MKKFLFVAVFLGLIIASSPVATAQTLTEAERQALLADLREQLVALMNQLIAKLQEDMAANTQKLSDIETKQAQQDEKLEKLGSATSPIISPSQSPNFSKLEISGSNNAFQVSLRIHDRDYDGYKIISYPQTLKPQPARRVDCSIPDPIERKEVCNTYDFFVPLAVPEIRDGSYDLPDDGSVYTFIIEADGKEYRANLKKGGYSVLVDNS